MLLIIAILLLLILATINIGDLQNQQSTVAQQNQLSAVTQVAQQGAAVYAACSANTVPLGNHMPADLAEGGLSNITAFGNSWGCTKVRSFINSTNATVVTFLDPPSSVPALGPANLAISVALQEYLADQVAEALIDRVQYAPNTLVGIIPAGSKSLSVLAPAGQTVPVLTTPLPYATPAIVGNLYATSPNNNYLAP